MIGLTDSHDLHTPEDEGHKLNLPVPAMLTNSSPSHAKGSFVKFLRDGITR